MLCFLLVRLCFIFLLLCFPQDPIIDECTSYWYYENTATFQPPFTYGNNCTFSFIHRYSSIFVYTLTLFALKGPCFMAAERVFFKNRPPSRLDLVLFNVTLIGNFAIVLSVRLRRFMIINIIPLNSNDVLKSSSINYCRAIS